MAPYKRPRSSQDGFSLATVMLIALAVILGSIAMIDRATSGWLGSLFVGQSREARDAAEIGLARVVSQLNRSRNRRLLVNAPALNESQDLAALETSGSAFHSPCASAASTPPQIRAGFNGFQKDFQDNDTKDSFVAITAEQAIDASSDADGTVRKFQIVSITQPLSSSERIRVSSGETVEYIKNDEFNIGIGSAAAEPRKGSIVITVKGLIYRGDMDKPVASTTITETLDVVPKCCGRSFAGLDQAFGNDTRRCDWPPMGIVTATANDTAAPGGITTAGAAVSFNAENQDNPLANILCVTAGCLDASNLNSNTGTTINEETDVLMPTAQDPNDPSKDNTFIAALTSLSTVDTCQGKDDNRCNISLDDDDMKDKLGILEKNTLVLDASKMDTDWPLGLRNVCEYKTEEQNNVEAIHCSINTLDFGANGRTIKFTNTNAHPVRLHFPNGSPEGKKTIDQHNNGSFVHDIRDKDGQIIPTTPINKATNLTLLGCLDINPECGEQYVDIGNGSSEYLDLFAYFRTGVMNIGGNGGFGGVLWTNKLIVNGSVSFNVPNGAVADVLTLMGMEGPTADQETPMVDWVARSVNSFKLF